MSPRVRVRTPYAGVLRDFHEQDPLNPHRQLHSHAFRRQTNRPRTNPHQQRRRGGFFDRDDGHSSRGRAEDAYSYNPPTLSFSQRLAHAARGCEHDSRCWEGHTSPGVMNLHHIHTNVCHSRCEPDVRIPFSEPTTSGLRIFLFPSSSRSGHSLPPYAHKRIRKLCAQIAGSGSSRLSNSKGSSDLSRGEQRPQARDENVRKVDLLRR